MKKMTKTTLIGAGLAAIAGALYVFFGGKAAKADAIDEEVDEHFDSLTTNNEPDNIEADVIEPEEEAETEPEEV